MRPLRDDAAISGEERGARGAEQDDQQHEHANSLSAQRQRVLNRLRLGPADTLVLRREEDVLMPAARIHELIHRFGFTILSTRVRRQTEAGRQHHGIALYALLAEPQRQEVLL